MMRLLTKLRSLLSLPHQLSDLQKRLASLENRIETVAQLCASMHNSRRLDSEFLHKLEYRVHSQWGEDGIIQALVQHLNIEPKTFIEFGVENYKESNTRWLLMNNNWAGLVIDGSHENIAYIRNDSISWKHSLRAVHAFITRENINALLTENGMVGEVGLLSIDIDGMDYWVWDAINCVQPTIVIVEYNSLFGSGRSVTVPYKADFNRTAAHYSTSYYGASLEALVRLARRKGYAFIGSNSAGNNAFFVLKNRLQSPLRELTTAEGYVQRKYREARDVSGALTLPTFAEEIKIIDGLPLEIVES
jgi:hypothetical protein